MHVILRVKKLMISTGRKEIVSYANYVIDIGGLTVLTIALSLDLAVKTVFMRLIF